MSWRQLVQLAARRPAAQRRGLPGAAARGRLVWRQHRQPTRHPSCTRPPPASVVNVSGGTGYRTRQVPDVAAGLTMPVLFLAGSGDESANPGARTVLDVAPSADETLLVLPTRAQATELFDGANAEEAMTALLGLLERVAPPPDLPAQWPSPPARRVPRSAVAAAPSIDDGPAAHGQRGPSSGEATATRRCLESKCRPRGGGLPATRRRHRRQRRHPKAVLEQVRDAVADRVRAPGPAPRPLVHQCRPAIPSPSISCRAPAIGSANTLRWRLGGRR